MAERDILKSEAPGLDLALSLCGSDGIEFQGQRFVPDATKGYFQFAFSHAFPVVTVYQTGIHPEVVAKSYASLLNQNLNYEHQISEYHKESGKDVRDRVIGGIVAVDFPRSLNGYRVNPDASKSPGITGVAVVYKQTQGMAKILGEHSANRTRYTVSMEVLWPIDGSGFAVALNGRDPKSDGTPEDMLKAGYEYFPYEQAPDELRATFSKKKNRVMTQYKGRKVHVLMGGLSNPVHYAGAGVVRFGAEPPAKIMRLAASAGNPLDSLATSLLRTFQSVTT